ncbi:MAG: LysR family transcriptional regulator [Alphaproteobacteria bacterium]|nr:LysR family transcriptional regulator [Alphaproteobacteria bacterium]
MARDPLPPLNWLRAFEASARHLSFTGAAQELNMTQSAISQQIKSLENYLGRTLFVRRTRVLQITDAGLNYLPTVQEAFATLAAGTRALIGGDRGKALTVQCNLAFSVFWLAPRLPKLLSLHPWLTLDIVTALWDQSRNESNSDVEVRFGRDLEGERLSRLTTDTCFPVCSPEVLERGGDWHSEALFDCGGILANWESWLAGLGKKLPEGKVVNFATTYVISLAAAQSGAGLALAHDCIVSEQLSAGALVRAHAASIPMLEAYYLMEPTRQNATPASGAFVDWVKSEAGLPSG